MGQDSGDDRLQAFDGLRACAALSVVAYHVSLSSALSRHGAFAPVFSLLKGGVAIFFVISGFLLYLPYARALRHASRLPSWRTYAQRRAVRIVPAYWVVLTVIAATSFGASIISGSWWRYYGLTQIYDRSTVAGGLPVAWSLCVEITFYLMLPFLALLAARLGASQRVSGRYRRQAVLIGGLAIGSLVLRGDLAGSVIGEVPRQGLLLATSLLGFLDWFAWGMGLAVCLSAWEARSDGLAWLRRFVALPGRSWGMAAVLFLLAARIDPTDLFLPLYGALPHLLIGAAALLLVAPAVVAARDHRLIRVLASPLAVWLGTISYGIYLWHVPVIEAINGSITVPPKRLPPFEAAGLLVLALAGAIALGALSWYLVERPAKRYLVRSRQTDRPAAQTPVARAPWTALVQGDPSHRSTSGPD